MTVRNGVGIVNTGRRALSVLTTEVALGVFQRNARTRIVLL